MNKKYVKDFEVKDDFLQYLDLFIDLSQEVYGVPMEYPSVFFFQGESVAGRGGLKNEEPYLEFNVDYLQEYWYYMVHEAIPHEVAHMVDYLLRGDSCHDDHWKQICLRLGGKAEGF